jgi:hypothetical protein
MTKVVRGLRQADDEAQEPMDMQQHDYSDYGANPLSPLVDPPAGEEVHEQHDDLVLIVKKNDKALIVDPRQHYRVITKTGKDWWEGTHKDLGAIGREKALRAFDKEQS